MKKLVILIVIGTVLLLLGILWLRMITNNKGKVDSVEVVNDSVKVFDSNYLYFEYPKYYNLAEIPVKDGRVYTNVSFGGNEEKVNLMTLLFRESTQPLDELVDVKMRRANTFQYTEEVARIGDYRGLLFKTADRKERVAFFMKKGRLLEVVMVSKEPDSPEIDNGFQSILNSVVWK